MKKVQIKRKMILKIEVKKIKIKVQKKNKEWMKVDQKTQINRKININAKV